MYSLNGTFYRGPSGVSGGGPAVNAIHSSPGETPRARGFAVPHLVLLESCLRPPRARGDGARRPAGARSIAMSTKRPADEEADGAAGLDQQCKIRREDPPPRARALSAPPPGSAVAAEVVPLASSSVSASFCLPAGWLRCCGGGLWLTGVSLGSSCQIFSLEI